MTIAEFAESKVGFGTLPESLIRQFEKYITYILPTVTWTYTVYNIIILIYI